MAAVALMLFAIQEPEPARIVQEISRFTPAELETMAAPIALHPDALLVQILMAATYPLEIVEADRWLAKNPGLAGPALEEALKPRSWDPSVKVLCGFPSVLKQMSDDLDWTRDLGDAFLGQKAELMDAVQRLREKAYDAGTLQTTDQQVVSSGDAIRIEPASPEIVYVPVYSPLVVYGPGWAPVYGFYPAFYAPPPYGSGFLAFGPGFAWGFALFGHCDWHHHWVFVDVPRYRAFAARTYWAPPPTPMVQGATGGHVEWRHDPVHRKGVLYRHPGAVSPLRTAPRFPALSPPAVPPPAARPPAPAPPVRSREPAVPPARARPGTRSGREPMRPGSG